MENHRREMERRREMECRRRSLCFKVDALPLLAIFDDMISPDASRREEGRQVYTYMVNKFPNFLVMRLANLVHSPDSDSDSLTRLRCAEELGRVLKGDSIWHRLTNITVSHLKQILVSCLNREQTVTGLKAICEPLCRLASFVLPNQSWPEFHELLYLDEKWDSEWDHLWIPTSDSHLQLQTWPNHHHKEFVGFWLLALLMRKLGHDFCVTYLDSTRLRLILPDLVLGCIRLPRVSVHFRAAAMAGAVAMLKLIDDERLALHGLAYSLIQQLYDLMEIDEILGIQALHELMDLGQASFQFLHSSIDVLVFRISDLLRYISMPRSKTYVLYVLKELATARNSYFAVNVAKAFSRLYTEGPSGYYELPAGLVSLQFQHQYQPNMIQVLELWGRLCEGLGEELVDYAQYAISEFIRSAALKISDPNHPRLQEKYIGCEKLLIIIEILKERGIHTWFRQIEKTLVPLLDYPLIEEIRLVAVCGILFDWHLFCFFSDATIVAFIKFATENMLAFPDYEGRPIEAMSRTIISALVEALKKEFSTGILETMVGTLGSCVENGGCYLEDGKVLQVLDVILHVSKANKDVDQDAIDECIKKLINNVKIKPLDLDNKILRVVGVLLGNAKTVKETKTALNIICESAKRGKSSSYATFIPLLLEVSKDKDAEVRQIAVRGIGLSAEYGGSLFKPHLGAAISFLKAEMTQPSPLAHAAAVYALGKICHLHCDGEQAYEVATCWLRHLPVQSNFIKVKDVHRLLYSIVEKFLKRGWPLREDFIVAVLKIAAEVICQGNRLATMGTVNQMRKLVLELWQKLTPPGKQIIFESVTLDQRNVLGLVLGQSFTNMPP